MTYDELVSLTIDEEVDPNEGALLMVRTEDGKMHSVKAITIENDEDSHPSGGATIWLDVEEF